MGNATEDPCDDQVPAEEEVVSSMALRVAEQTGVLLVGEVHYAVRVRGRSGDAIAVALQEGLGFVVDPVRTVLRGRLPDQGALLGILARVRLLGLELVEVKRLPQQATDDLDHQPAAEISTSQT